MVFLLHLLGTLKKIIENKFYTMKKINQFSTFILAASLIIASCTKTATRSNSGNNNPPLAFNGTVQKDISYGSNVDYFGITEDLKLDLYTPAPTANGKNGKFPLYVWVHGGGFLVGGKAGGDTQMILMANKGFISAAINYRLGWNRDRTAEQCSGDSTSLKEAIYRAVQDLHASIRFLVANADKYNIDTNYIFIGGQSAGGVDILNTAYINQDYANLMVPNAIARFGLLDRADNNLTNTFTIKGLESMWGGLNTDQLITAANAIPTIFFHGELDNVVPYDIGTVYQCPDQLPVYGTKPLYARLSSLSVPALAYIDVNAGHGAYTDEFRADNTAIFFQSIMDGNPITGYKYVDGPPYRGDAGF